MKHLFARSLSFVIASVLPTLALAQPPAPQLPPPAQTAPAPADAPVIEYETAPPTAPPWKAPPPLEASSSASTPAEAPTALAPPRPEAWRLSLGARVGYVGDPGFDPYASNDVLAQFSLEGTRTLARASKISLAAGLAYDIGGRSDGFRGAESKLTSHRFTVPIEARFEATPWLQPFARVAPGAGLVLARVDDASTPSRLTDSKAIFAADVSGGVSFLIGPWGKSDPKMPHFWITPEAGYAFGSTAKLAPSPGRDDKDVLGTDAASALRPVALNGFFWRLSAAVTF